MARSWLQVALIALFCGGGLAADDSTVEVRAGNSLYRVVSRTEDSFTPDKLRRMAMDFISEVRSAHLRVGCLELVSASSKSVLNAAHSNERVEFMELVSRSKAAATKRFNGVGTFFETDS